ncbi:MAG: FTR1 family protein, partial [Actinomycetota bacterium]|nr:FTR1 family protein [Actinomycetota bacterium]
MFVTFVIGLREGLEAALIVGIIAGFVVVRGDRRALRQVFLGVAAAVLLSLALALTLLAINRSLPFRQREMMEGVLALVAAAGVAYMIVWMRRNGRLLRSNLELRTASALAKSSVVALVVMAFLAV